RGIGLELTRQLIASSTNEVLATCRHSAAASESNDLSRNSNTRKVLHISELNTSSIESINIEGILGGHGLDYLVNNAAVVTIYTTVDFKPADLPRVLLKNVIGQAHLSQVQLPLIEKSHKKFINFSSGIASMGLDHPP
ncbi:hypothetical protein BC629DRAFT_1293411, partial [Irpex lacteus]